YIDRITLWLPAIMQYQDKKYPLRISKVVPEVKDRSFTCDLVFTADKPSNIRLGKSYRVQIELGQPETTLTIPHGNFSQVTSGHWLYRLSPDGKTARKVEIEIGRQNPQQYEIVSGLKPGDKVLVTGYDKFGDVEELVIK
ncbi:MAG: efflux transporter periplasmic adaptor subunit, partial [Prevotella sp.]|nr:efflux transporter periplasmic adaptor subunit [Prevotella sp.]